MSHATVLVAIDPTDDIDSAIAEQMAPFDENDSMFRDGSRWDWYVVGGRYDGLINGENVVERKSVDKDAVKPCFAFLRNKHWHENERMGWFGGSASTECERHDNGNGDRAGKCLFRDKESGAEIVCWKSDAETWANKFWDRFVKPLDPNTLLVVVDYHV